MGIGRVTTPDSFQKACEIFTYTEILSERPKKEIMLALRVSATLPALPDSADDNSAKSKKNIAPQVPDWKKTLLKAIEMSSQDEWASLGYVGHNARKVDSAFDPRTYGKNKLLPLIRTAPKLFELREEKHDPHPSIYYIRVISQ